MGRFLPLVIFAVIFAFLGVGLTITDRVQEVPSPLIDKPAPRFSLPSLEDPTKSVTDTDLKGQVSLVNVWASWCAGCRQEHDLLVQIDRMGVAPIIGLNYRDERADAQRWLNRYGNPYTTVAYDGDGRVSIDWGVYGAPETFVVDGEGMIRYKHIGPLTPDVLEKTIVPMVQQLQARLEGAPAEEPARNVSMGAKSAVPEQG